MPKHEIVRMRQETRRRQLTVASVEQLTPRMRRIIFTSNELHDFNSPSADDHVKLFFPSSGSSETNTEPAARDFTPRNFDRESGTLVVDFALHESGPATQWAAQAQVDDALEVGGPRGSAIVPDDFDWYLLIGDEPALPSIARRVEGLRSGVPVRTIVAISEAAEAQRFSTPAQWEPVWVVRNVSEPGEVYALKEALDGQDLPEGDGFVWIAAERSVAAALYAYMVEERHHPKDWIKAASYWERGKADAHGKIG